MKWQENISRKLWTKWNFENRIAPIEYLFMYVPKYII